MESLIENKVIMVNSRCINVVIMLLLLGVSSQSQAQSEVVSAVIPTIQQEATSIWRTINDITFFEKQGYTVNLPQAELIDSFIVKSKNGTFGNDDFQLIYELLESKVYNESSYKLALEKIYDKRQLIHEMIYQLASDKNDWAWDFKMFKQYHVVLTLYGSGGSYDPNTGSITLFTTEKGDFKNYEHPENTIIHEIVHIGIEKSIVEKHNLSHVEKEGLVDQFVYVMFEESLPNYKIQHFGDTKMDELIKEKDDLKRLESIINEYQR